ncbi:DUF2860 family protein [Photobacterium sp. 1_MG-2023]|uniref:DUF2860 family protein n=1 Tax=Photobacterium sp. 1_MG-2023 TaxID=3062646 RepID=UPI0026E3267C|nr:DUF2860 family protein [Photobacterium sp. 1_MG-2023]MDO6706881.1 DUF2860 family protein [Photobacterium sp. 1_MG-2023]
MHRILRQTALTLTALSAFSVSAQQSVRPGLSGDVSINLGWFKNDSKLSTEQSSVLNSLNDPGKDEEKTLPVPMWNLQLGLSPSTALYFKSALGGMASSFYVQAGVTQSLYDGSAIGLGFIPGFFENEVWDDPFQTGSPRQETKRTIRGFVFDYENIAGSQISLELAGGKRRIDDERSGSGYDTEAQSALKREGDLYYAALSQTLPFSRDFSLDWQLHYLGDDAQGGALANQRYGAELTAKQRYHHYIFMLGASGARIDYDERHPIFHQVREDNRYGVSLTLIYLAPFQWQNVSAIARAGYDTLSSNIDFYDENQSLYSIGLAYRF